MQKGNVNGALNFLANEMSNGMLPLTEIKHANDRDASEGVPLNGPIREIHPIVFDAIDEEIVLRAASITKDCSSRWKLLLHVG